MEISHLPLDVIVKLRTGIAITTVPHCVEELVLNAIDANANCIAVRLNLPFYKIQVIDNGDGIPLNQMSKLGERYATSKCHSVKDLEQLSTHGFRGEALASLKNVSSALIIESRHVSSKESYCKVFTQGQGSEVQKSGTSRCSKGTTVTVQDFMYNMPVRKQCISETLDLENCRKFLERLVLSHPHISVSLRNDSTGEICLETRKCSSMVAAFSCLFGRERTLAMRETHFHKENYVIHGLISTEGCLSKDLQIVFVNRRFIGRCKIHKIVNSILFKAILSRQKSNAKETSQPAAGTAESPNKSQSQYGIFILNISCPHSHCDVILEPKKTSVIFSDPDKVLRMIEEAMYVFLKGYGYFPFAEQKETPDCGLNSESGKGEIAVLDEKDQKAFPKNAGEVIDVQDVKRALFSLPAKRNSMTPSSPECSSVKKQCHDSVSHVSQNRNSEKYDECTQSIEVQADLIGDATTSEGETNSKKKCDVFSSNQASVSTTTHKFCEKFHLLNASNKLADNFNVLAKAASERMSNLTLPKRSVFPNPNPVMLLAPSKCVMDDILNSKNVSASNHLKEKYQFKKSKLNLRSKHHHHHRGSVSQKGSKSTQNVKEVKSHMSDEIRILISNQILKQSQNVQAGRNSEDSPAVNLSVMSGHSDVCCSNSGNQNASKDTNGALVCRREVLNDVVVSSKYSLPERAGSSMFGRKFVEQEQQNNGQQQHGARQNLSTSRCESSVESVVHHEHKKCETSKEVTRVVSSVTSSKTSKKFELITLSSVISESSMQQKNVGSSLKEKLHSAYLNRFCDFRTSSGQGTHTETMNTTCSFEMLATSTSQNCTSTKESVPTSCVKFPGAAHHEVLIKGESNKIIAEGVLCSSITCQANNSPDISGDGNGSSERGNSESLLDPLYLKSKNCLTHDFSDTSSVQDSCKELAVRSEVAHILESNQSVNTESAEVSSTAICQQQFENELNADRHFLEKEAMTECTQQTHLNTDSYNVTQSVHAAECKELCTVNSRNIGESTCMQKLEYRKPPDFTSTMLNCMNKVEQEMTEVCADNDYNIPTDHQHQSCVISFEHRSDQLRAQSSHSSENEINTASGVLSHINSCKSPQILRQLRTGHHCSVNSSNQKPKGLAVKTDCSNSLCKNSTNFLNKTCAGDCSVVPLGIHFAVSSMKDSDGTGGSGLIAQIEKPESSSMKTRRGCFESSENLVPTGEESMTYQKDSTGLEVVSVHSQTSILESEEGSESSMLETRARGSCSPSTHCTSVLLNMSNISKNSTLNHDNSGDTDSQQPVCNYQHVTEENSVIGTLNNMNEADDDRCIHGISVAIHCHEEMISKPAGRNVFPKHSNSTEESSEHCTADQAVKAAGRVLELAGGIQVDMSVPQSSAQAKRWFTDNEPVNSKTCFIDSVTGNSSYKLPQIAEISSLHGNEEKSPNGAYPKSHFFLTHDADAFMGQPLILRGNLKQQSALLSDESTSFRKALGNCISELDDDDDVTDIGSVKWSIPKPSESDLVVEDLFSNWENPMFQKSFFEMDTANNIAPYQNQKSMYNVLNVHRFSRSAFSSLKVIGQVDQKFIACVIQDVNENYRGKSLLVLFDQHAVHERVRLEQLYEGIFEVTSGGKKQLKSSELETPLELEFRPSEARLLRTYKSHLSQTGFKLEHNGNSQVFTVHSVPTFIVKKVNGEMRRKHATGASCTVEQVIREWLAFLEETRPFTSCTVLPKTLQGILNSKACKGAVKFGDPLNLPECVSLLQMLSVCNLPFQCAHGRPSLAPVLNLAQIKTSYQEVSKPKLWKLVASEK